ncbi:MAG: HipA N-terminal domain-containing protein [Bacteroidetes bacterium]|nr:HipA N-terminal domain-containing protein [Bacteroidota bacterium]MDA1119420.1 HipA N-terminal domain-containing protein [Bacteroidota bacterium]
MKRVLVKMHDIDAGVLIRENPTNYIFQYDPVYNGPAISLTMPIKDRPYSFNGFPPFFDGLLPEGIQLDGLLKIYKIDRDDYFTQLVTIGADLVGAVTVLPLNNDDE